MQKAICPWRPSRVSPPCWTRAYSRQEEGPNGEPRFVMLETIHEFAREKLGQSTEAEEIKRVHAQYFLI